MAHPTPTSRHPRSRCFSFVCVQLCWPLSQHTALILPYVYLAVRLPHLVASLKPNFRSPNCNILSKALRTTNERFQSGSTGEGQTVEEETRDDQGMDGKPRCSNDDDDDDDDDEVDDNNCSNQHRQPQHHSPTKRPSQKNGCTNERTNAPTNQPTNEPTIERTHKRTNAQTDGRTDGRSIETATQSHSLTHTLSRSAVD